MLRWLIIGSFGLGYELLPESYISNLNSQQFISMMQAHQANLLRKKEKSVENAYFGSIIIGEEDVVGGEVGNSYGGVEFVHVQKAVCGAH